MNRVLLASPAVSTQSLSLPYFSSAFEMPQKKYLENKKEDSNEVGWMTVDVVLFGSKCAWFTVTKRSNKEVRVTAERIYSIPFPKMHDNAPMEAEGESRFALLEALQSAADKGLACSSNAIHHKHCPYCLGKHRGIATVSKLHMEGRLVVLFFVLECDCIVFASFELDTSIISSNDEECKIQLLAVRWYLCDVKEIEGRRAAPRQWSVPIDVILDSNKGSNNNRAFSYLSTALNSSLKPGERDDETASRYFNRPNSSVFVLRIVFARVVGWIELVELIWQNVEDECTSPWQTLSGFLNMAVGSLPLETDNNNVGGAQGEVRTLHWLPFSHDYLQRYPLLAVLHQHAAVAGDPFLDRLSVCMISAERIEQESPNKPYECVCALQKLRGTCIDGPWYLEALTLAHPSFLLHIAVPSDNDRGNKIDVLGVFLRPASIAYPMSAILREPDIHNLCRSLIFGAKKEMSEEERNFCFSLYTESGEVTRCRIDSFVENAVSCSVLSDEIKQDKSSVFQKEWVVAVVLAMQSGGDVLFLEVKANFAQKTSEKFKDSSLLELFIVKRQFLSLIGFEEVQSLSHLYQFVNVRWSGREGTALFLAAHEDANSGHVDCSLWIMELCLQKRGESWVVCGSIGVVSESSALGKQGRCCQIRGFPCRVGITAFLQPLSTLDEDFTAGSALHAALQPLSCCTLQQENVSDAIQSKKGEEFLLFLFRSGDIFLMHRSVPSVMHKRVDATTISFRRLAKVQWPSAENTAAVVALAFLFASGSYCICMEAFSTGVSASLPIDKKINRVPDLNHIQLLLVYRSTVIFLNTSGQVVCVSDLCVPPCKFVGHTKVCDTQSEPEDEREEYSLFLPCMIRRFVSYESNNFFILSVTTTLLPSTEDGSRQCLFLLLHVTYCAKTSKSAVSSLTIAVVDIFPLKTNGHPLFDFLPTWSIDNHTVEILALKAEETALYVGEIMYCAADALCSLPCAIVSHSTCVKGRFAQPPLCGFWRVLNLRQLPCEENVTVTFSEPTLLCCVSSPFDSHAAVVVLSFISGVSLVAVAYCGTVSCRQWIVQVLSTASTITRDALHSPNPFMRLVTCNNVPNRNGVLCWLQDTCGEWHSLVYRSVGEITSLSCDVTASTLQWLDHLCISAQPALDVAHNEVEESEAEDIVFLHAASAMFTLGSC